MSSELEKFLEKHQVATEQAIEALAKAASYTLLEMNRVVETFAQIGISIHNTPYFQQIQEQQRQEQWRTDPMNLMPLFHQALDLFLQPLNTIGQIAVNFGEKLIKISQI